MNLWSFLCCPFCHGAIIKKKTQLWCKKCQRSYPVRMGIPILVDLHALPEHLRKQVEYFEQEDEDRGQYLLEPWQERYVQVLSSNLGRTRNSLIIDNATGSGYIAIGLAMLGYRVIATDLTLQELIKLQRTIRKMNLQSLILPVCSNSELLPIRTNVATVVVSNAILEHLPNEQSAIGEIMRVLKPRGIAMIAVPLSYRYLFPLLLPLNWFHDRRIGHLRRYSRREILRKFRGCSELMTYYTGHLPKVITVLIALAFVKDRRILEIGERFDRMLESVPLWASNVVCILRKR